MDFFPLKHLETEVGLVQRIFFYCSVVPLGSTSVPVLVHGKVAPFPSESYYLWLHLTFLRSVGSGGKCQGVIKFLYYLITPALGAGSVGVSSSNTISLRWRFSPTEMELCNGWWRLL